MVQPEVAVVIPTLDEAIALELRLPAVVETGAEVIVSDGGSSDATSDTALRLGAQVVTGPPGRGAQLNRGAAATSAPIVLFLHADTTLPAGAVERVVEAVSGGAIGGGFEVRFEGNRVVYRLGAAVVNLRSRLFKTPLGDQAQFATRTAFDAINGYREWPVMEDLDFVRRLKTRGPLAILSPPVTTSSRRFEENGPARTVAKNWLIFALFYARVPPERLARFYRDVREPTPGKPAP